MSTDKKKTVLKLDVHDVKCKKNAMKAVSGLPGIDSIAIDIKEKKLTVIGEVDPVAVVKKLEKWCAQILTVGPAKEEKKEEKKDDGKKDEGKKVCYPPYYCVVKVDESPSFCTLC